MRLFQVNKANGHVAGFLACDDSANAETLARTAFGLHKPDLFDVEPNADWREAILASGARLVDLRTREIGD